MVTLVGALVNLRRAKRAERPQNIHSLSGSLHSKWVFRVTFTIKLLGKSHIHMSKMHGCKVVTFVESKFNTIWSLFIGSLYVTIALLFIKR